MSIAARVEAKLIVAASKQIREVESEQYVLGDVVLCCDALQDSRLATDFLTMAHRSATRLAGDSDLGGHRLSTSSALAAEAVQIQAHKRGLALNNVVENYSRSLASPEHSIPARQDGGSSHRRHTSSGLGHHVSRASSQVSAPCRSNMRNIPVPIIQV